MHNLIEPPSLIAHFLRHPPEDFSVFKLMGDVPAFATNFDLLTTMEPAERRKLEALPFAAWWRGSLRSHTCFVGATVSEYALFPIGQSPERFVVSLLQETTEYACLIVKDIPADPVLVGKAAHDYSQALVKSCQRAGFVLVEGQALAYVPIDFGSTEAYLARMSKSRRKDIKRKLRSTEHLEIQAVPTGDAWFGDDVVLAELYALYCNVYDQSEVHFDLLTFGFFQDMLRDAHSNGVVFLYHAGGELIGYNLCFVHNGMLLDKYIGFAYPKAREFNLYFVSWMHNLQYALEHGLTHYIAGWTDPEIKRHLGASFVFTQHAVYFRNPWLRQVLKPFKRYFEADKNWHAVAADS